MRFLLTLWISKFLAFAVNLIDKKRGSNFSGMIAVKLLPGFVARFKGIDYNKVFFISGTNGKSTTTNLLYHTLTTAGKTVACNNEGANMMTGIATALIKNSSLLGCLNKEYLVLEIDERSFPGIHKVLPGLHLGLTNLQKDQVQRNGDPDFILRKFRGAITEDMTLYLNNEEPRSRSLEDCVKNVRYFSVAENSKTYVTDDFYAVTLPCPKCAHPIAYDSYNLANIGAFHCTACDYASQSDVQVRITDLDFENNAFSTEDTRWNVPYNNPFYIYNFAMVIAICRNIGLTDEEIQKGFSSFKNPATHVNTFHSFGKEIHYLQGKQENPEALQSQLDIIASDKREKAVFVGMYEITDFDPYYSGSFYFFDCDFAPIVKSNTSHYVAFSKTIAADLAQRMILAGAGPENVTIRDTNDPAEIFDMLPQLQAEVVYILTNTKHVPEIKGYLSQGGASHE